MKLEISPNITHLHIYTDGGYFEKMDIGGWGLVIYKNDVELYRDSGWQKQTSSLEMELVAAQKALEHVQQYSSQTVFPIENICKTLYTDSRIVIEGLTQKYTTWCQNHWKVKSGKTVVYKELWQALSNLTEQQKVEWKWVKGHNGNLGNTIADQLARDAVTKRNANN
ncbi:MAG TPA: ribonuclease HI [Thiomicrospira sp.]|jgi:ribonuclease HI|nr:ribonuclease HI [Thiomicrospira sp.]